MSVLTTDTHIGCVCLCFRKGSTRVLINPRTAHLPWTEGSHPYPVVQIPRIELRYSGWKPDIITVILNLHCGAFWQATPYLSSVNANEDWVFRVCNEISMCRTIDRTTQGLIGWRLATTIGGFTLTLSLNVFRRCLGNYDRRVQVSACSHYFAKCYFVWFLSGTLDFFNCYWGPTIQTYLRYFVEAARLERATHRTKICCSTDWTTLQLPYIVFNHNQFNQSGMFGLGKV